MLIQILLAEIQFEGLGGLGMCGGRNGFPVKAPQPFSVLGRKKGFGERPSGSTNVYLGTPLSCASF
jgi:hypothetical protein